MGWIERQLPQGKEIFLDHIGYFVDDIYAVSGAFERLGFNVSSVNIHYNSLGDGTLVKAGTANRLITLGIGYIELLGAVSETPLADELREQLARYKGLHLLAFSHSDVSSERDRLDAAGFEPQPTVRLRRFVETREGEKTLRATVVRANRGSMPEGRVQILFHETPELIWMKGLEYHRNRADALTDVLTVTDDPDEAMDRYARFTGCEGSIKEELRVIELSRGELAFASVELASRILPDMQVPNLPYIAAVGLRSENLDVTRDVLSEGGIAYHQSYRSVVCVSQQDGLGAQLVFHAGKMDCPWLYLK